MNPIPTDPQLLTRHTDTALYPPSTAEAAKISWPELPAVNWSAINQAPPVVIPVGDRKPDDPLPAADWIIITWTSAEWQALDHVFINSNSNPPTAEWRKNWQLYTRGAAGYTADAKSGTLWGYFQLVQITDQDRRPWRVLLFKSNAHLAHAPWIDGLSGLMKCLLGDTKAGVVYTIGTAGGARLNQCLGDAVVTNLSVLELQRPQNTHDGGNGYAYRCPTWYPSTNLLQPAQDNLLMKIDSVVTRDALNNLFNQLKEKHKDDPSFAHITLDDLLNEALDPDKLGKPAIHSMKDVPLLTTDFYYIATGDSAGAYSFLEMDDAVIMREANALGARVACIRNISDPVVPDKTKSGQPISDSIRGDWSGLIYTNFGLFTSFNGAVATWATIAGQGSPTYNPARFTLAPDANDPLEVKLAWEVRSCGTCSFFWPDDKAKATYGPYTAFDFDTNIPYPNTPDPKAYISPWVLGRTREPAFPNGEISDGCRKAPIMTIGINPNLTAFAPGQNGAAWAYPDFSSDDGTNAWAKYAWYYRYRSVYQEKLDLDFVKKFLVEDGQVAAAADGKIIKATRSSEDPSWSIEVQYTGHASPTTIQLPGTVGDFPYVLLFDSFAPNNTFAAGDVLAAKLAVPGGIQTQVYQEQQGYYMQFVPSLNDFQDYLQQKGHSKASLRIGEDVSQLDMVACASPHWTEGYLGNEMQTVVNNCVSKNAWAIKQLVQTRPAVLYIVSESSWDMFNSIVGKFVDPGRISDKPADQAYTLFRETSDPAKPVYMRFDITIDGVRYNSKTRIVITPHFSFNTNFLPQYRMSPADFAMLAQMTGFADAITSEHGFTILPADPKHDWYYREIQLTTEGAAAARSWLQQNNPDLYNKLEPYYYNPHAMMADVMKGMYDSGELSYNDDKNFLGRTEGSCRFCVNQHWQFPNECRYGKTTETPPPSGFLEKVAEYIIANGAVEKEQVQTNLTK